MTAETRIFTVVMSKVPGNTFQYIVTLLITESQSCKADCLILPIHVAIQYKYNTKLILTTTRSPKEPEFDVTQESVSFKTGRISNWLT